MTTALTMSVFYQRTAVGHHHTTSPPSLTTREAAWYVGLILAAYMHVCLTVCLYVCTTRTIESLAVESSLSVCEDNFTGYGSSRVIRSRSRSITPAKSAIFHSSDFFTLPWEGWVKCYDCQLEPRFQNGDILVSGLIRPPDIRMSERLKLHCWTFFNRVSLL